MFVYAYSIFQAVCERRNIKMAKFTDMILKGMAKTAKTAFDDSMGLASRGCAYEPATSDELRAYKELNVSKIEKLFNKLTK